MQDLPAARSPIYPVSYAARLAGVDARAARRWLRGYRFSHKGERRDSAAIVPMKAAPETPLTFDELLTLRLVGAFRRTGLGLPAIRKAAEIARTRYGLENPFITKAFRSDGRQIFIELRRQFEVDDDETLLIHALTGQQEFKRVVEPSLFQDVVFAGDTPGQWFPQGKRHSVVIRPDRVFGAPHILDTRIRTDVIADAVKANGADDGAVRIVAEWFDLKPRQIQDALRAEAEWRTPIAA
jgi:uncharacterized protein (DUF433 family)